MQRMEITYFAACCLMPKTAAISMLQRAKGEKDLSVEDFRDVFGVTRESASHRFTNLATSQLGIPVHFLRVSRDGALLKGYENDGVNFPADVTGAIEGQTTCRHWTSRQVFDHGENAGGSANTPTPPPDVLVPAHTGKGTDGGSPSPSACHSRLEWFRGRETTSRTVSTCPDPACCRRPAAALHANGPTHPGRARNCTPTSSAHYHQAPSQASTTPRSTHSSNPTRQPRARPPDY